MKKITHTHSRLNHKIVVPEKDLWVFGYGSLIWNPGFVYTDCATARIYGYSRKLCMRSTHYRGTKQQPGLVAGLTPGGSCVGISFKVANDAIEETVDYLLKREMIAHDYYSPIFISAYTLQGTVHKALTFASCINHPQYVNNLSIEQTIDIVRTARGQRGSNIEYLVNTFSHLEQLGIVDKNLKQICSFL